MDRHEARFTQALLYGRLLTRTARTDETRRVKIHPKFAAHRKRHKKTRTNKSEREGEMFQFSSVVFTVPRHSKGVLRYIYEIITHSFSPSL